MQEGHWFLEKTNSYQLKVQLGFVLIIKKL